MSDKINYISHRNGIEFYFNTPSLVYPDRDPDFIVEYEDKQYPKWSHKSEFYIEERILAFSSVETPEVSLVKLMIDERYGIYADETYKQDSSSWQLQSKATHDAYINWVTCKELL